mmetsp:Transcript_10577/g.21292  ORF Transcript_10577/g.21292 Transcript_10577/m.21292 type:complete len:126 (-) Transcript_10577:2605-2982(-)
MCSPGSSEVLAVCVQAPTGEFVRVNVENEETVADMVRKARGVWTTARRRRRWGGGGGQVLGLDEVRDREAEEQLWRDRARVAVGWGGVYMLLAAEAKLGDLFACSEDVLLRVVNDRKDVDSLSRV